MDLKNLLATVTITVKTLSINIYILGVSTEKPNSKPLERNVVYIPITMLSHGISVAS